MPRSTARSRLPGSVPARFATAVNLVCLAVIAGPPDPFAPLAGRSAMAAPQRPADAFEWPVSIASSPLDGVVWVGIASDVANWGGVFRFTRDLAPGPGWGLHGAPKWVSTALGSGDVVVEEMASADPEAFDDRILARFRRDGRHEASWSAPEGLLDFDAGPVAGGEGVFALYEDAATGRPRVRVSDALGRELDSWDADVPLRAEGASTLAADPSGDVWVGFRHVFVGAIRRFTADGQVRADLAYGAVPVAMDADAVGRIFVAGVYDLPSGNVTRLNPDGSRGLDCGINNAMPLDIAAGPDAGFYLLVRLNGTTSPLGDRELRRYDAACTLLAQQRVFGPVQGTPHPPTATQAPPSPTPDGSTTPTVTLPPASPTAPPTHTPGIPPSETPGRPPATATFTPSTTPSPTPPGRTAFLPLAVSGVAMSEIVHSPAIVVIPDGIDPADWPADPFAIREAAVEGPRLKLSVRFGGGCRPHDFGLVASSLFMESHPVQANLLLTHDAHGDMCRALLYRDLVFDLRPLRAAYEAAYPGSPGPVLLRLRGWNGLITYAW